MVRYVKTPTYFVEITHDKDTPVANNQVHHFEENGCFLNVENLEYENIVNATLRINVASNKINLESVTWALSKHTIILENKQAATENPKVFMVKNIIGTIAAP